MSEALTEAGGLQFHFHLSRHRRPSLLPRAASAASKNSNGIKASEARLRTNDARGAPRGKVPRKTRRIFAIVSRQIFECPRARGRFTEIG